jgi:hypothetical protein
LVYGLLDPPAPAPRKPFLQAWFDIGNALEHNWIRRLRNYGVLLSADVTAEDDFQTGFEDEEHWLTGSCDAIVLPRGWMKPHLVEIKTTSHEKVLAMRAEKPTFPLQHPKYVRQLKTYIGLAHEMPYTPTVHICNESGAIISSRDDYICPIHGQRCAFESIPLMPPDDGTLIYSSREDPLTTASFRVFYDPEFLAVGRVRLAEWRDYFLRGEIPAHPYEGRAKKWTAPACANCDFKGAFCKTDYQNKTMRLSDSNLIGFARGIRPDYDLEQKRSSVLFRWGAEDLSRRQEEMAGVSND